MYPKTSVCAITHEASYFQSMYNVKHFDFTQRSPGLAQICLGKLLMLALGWSTLSCEYVVGILRLAVVEEAMRRDDRM